LQWIVCRKPSQSDLEDRDRFAYYSLEKTVQLVITLNIVFIQKKFIVAI